MTWKLMIAAAALIGAATPAAAAVTFDFELGPGDLASTSPLAHYNGATWSGMTLEGAATAKGGHAIADNHGFGISARSGVDYLAFNALVTSPLEKVALDSGDITNAEIYLASPFAQRMMLAGYKGLNDMGDPMFDFVEIDVVAGEWTRFAIYGTYSYILFGAERSSFYPWLADDLALNIARPGSDPIEPPSPAPGGTGAPEPGVWALMIAGFGLTGAALRRRCVRLA